MTTEQENAVSEEILVEAPKVTVGFERKVNLGDYESATGSIFIQVPTTPDMDAAAIAEAAKLAFADGKATVYEQLGIVFDIVEGVVVEKLRQGLGAVEVSAASEAQAVKNAGTGPQRATVQSSNAGDKYGPTPESKDESVENLLANPKNWYDNRATKKGRQPDFKFKGSPLAGEKYPPSLWAADFPKGVDIPEPSAF